MFYFNAIIIGLGIVGIISGATSIYMFIESRKHPIFRRRGVAFSVVTVGMVLLALIFAAIQGLSANTEIKPTATPIIQNFPLRVISSPHYAKVTVTLLSTLLLATPSQYLQLNFLFKNDGANICRNIKFHTITLTDLTGIRYHAIGQANQEWTLDAGKTIQQSPLSQEPPQQGLRYTLRLSLDVGGCVTPTDISKNKYADYQSVSFPI